MKRQLDRDCYYVAVSSNGEIREQLSRHTLTVKAESGVLELSAAFYAADSVCGQYAAEGNRKAG